MSDTDNERCFIAAFLALFNIQPGTGLLEQPGLTKRPMKKSFHAFFGLLRVHSAVVTIFFGLNVIKKEEGKDLK